MDPLTTLEIDDDSNPVTPGVAPITSSFEDVDGDGKIDLVLHFDTQQLNSAGLLADGQTLYITGQFSDGKLLVGTEPRGQTRQSGQSKGLSALNAPVSFDNGLNWIKLSGAMTR